MNNSRSLNLALISFSKLVLVYAFVLAPCCALAQDKATNSSQSTDQLESTYLDSVGELKQAIKDLERLEALYFHASSEESHDFKEQWDEAAEKSEEIFGRVQKNAFALFLADATPDEDLVKVVFGLNSRLFEASKLDLCYKITKKLLSLDPENDKLKQDMARIAVMTNDFDYAHTYANEPGNRIAIGKFGMKEQVLFSYIDELKENFDREKQLQEKDKTADLPRVEITIRDRGKVVIELFEDEAPETVANFISLIETGIYDGIIFHRVIKTYMAHTGFQSMNKVEPIGYTIYDECGRPDRRHHFRGTVSMWSDTSEPNTAGGQFYILNIPAPYMTKANHTVFGRVVEGMEVVDSLQETVKVNEEKRTEEVIQNRDLVPDMIESIKIIRKRDHPYEPNRVKE